MTGVSIYMSHQREICLEVSEIRDIICFPPYSISKTKNPALSADLHTLFFTLKCNLLFPLRYWKSCISRHKYFPHMSMFQSLCKRSVRGKAHWCAWTCKEVKGSTMKNYPEGGNATPISSIILKFLFSSSWNLIFFPIKIIRMNMIRSFSERVSEYTHTETPCGQDL